jgi:very-short-patch-repair endonuclease
VTHPLDAGVECHVVPVERRIVELAARQYGVVTAQQLGQAGLGRHGVAHRVSTGWLKRLHRGVYFVGSVEPALARPMAAVLAAGDGALLSHNPAAVLWGQRPPPAGELHVTVAGRNARGADGVQIHRVRCLHPSDVTRHHGIPVTSPARTLLDLAATVSPRDLQRAVEEAEILNLVTDHSLDGQFRRYPNHRGRAALEQVTRTEPRLTRSEAERRLLELIRDARLPEPETNATVLGYEVDFLWREQRLIVEVDGFAFHSTRAAFERDRRRDALLQDAGFRVLRVTWGQIADEPVALAVMLARATASAAAARDTADQGADREAAA